MEYLALTALLALLTTAIVHLRRRSVRARQAIGELRPGWAEVRGRVHGSAGELHKPAPISGRRGIGWRVLVEQESGVRGWEPIVDLSEFVDFELRDDSGSIKVRASNSPISLDVGEQRGKGGPFSPPPAVVERLIARHANPQGVLFHKGFRWSEWVLEDGREIRVKGRVMSVPAQDQTQLVGYRRLGEELILAGGTAQPLELAD